MFHIHEQDLGLRIVTAWWHSFPSTDCVEIPSCNIVFWNVIKESTYMLHTQASILRRKCLLKHGTKEKIEVTKDEEDWMTLRTREGTGNWRGKHYSALCGKLVSEVSMDLSFDRQQNKFYAFLTVHLGMVLVNKCMNEWMKGWTQQKHLSSTSAHNQISFKNSFTL